MRNVLVAASTAWDLSVSGPLPFGFGPKRYLGLDVFGNLASPRRVFNHNARFPALQLKLLFGLVHRAWPDHGGGSLVPTEIDPFDDQQQRLELGDISRHTPSLVRRKHLCGVGLSLRLPPIDIGEGLAGDIAPGDGSSAVGGGKRRGIAEAVT